jgi:autotransporter-associated beta strand protein
MKKKSNWLNLTALSLLLITTGVSAQNLIISTAGQTGTSGTNWSTSGSNPVTISVIGTANINPSVVTGYLNAGKNLNLVVSSGDVIIKSKIATNATAENLRFSIYNQSKGFINLTAEGSILAFRGNLDVLLQTKGSINMAASATIASNGGTIRLQAIEETGRLKRTVVSKIALMGTVNASSDTKGGKIFIESDAIQLHPSARVFAKGKRGGGTILIGGDWQGGSVAEKRETETMQQAITVTMDRGAILDASAIENGDGGKVVLWSNLDHPASNTQAHGQLLAMGKGNRGKGGMIETSGAAINFDGVSVSSIASNGTAGEWLIDPHNLYFSTSDLSTIASNLASNNITITTATNTNTGAGASNNIFGRGHIVFRDNLTYTGSSARTLTLTADQDIWINGFINATNGALSLNFNAGNRILFDDYITTNGGAVTFNNNAKVHFQQTSGTQNLNTNGGNLVFNSADVFLLRHSGSVALNTAGGELNLGTGTIQQTNTFNQINAISVLLNSWQGAHANGSKTYGINIVAGREYTTRMYFWDSWDGGEQGQLFVRRPNNTIDYYFQGERTAGGGFTVALASNGAQFSASGVSHMGRNSTYLDQFVDVTFVAVASGTLETWTNLNEDVNNESLELNNFYETQFPSFLSSGSRSLSLNTTTGQLVGSSKNVSDLANLTVNTNNDLGSIGGVISGTTNFIKEGTGTFTLTQNNTYSGNTTINAGTLVLQNNAPNPTNKTFNGPGALRIESTGTAFTGVFSTSGWSFGATLSGLTLGKSGNTANVTSAVATTIAGPISLFGAAIAINAALTATNNNINLTASGAITQTAAITANGLALIGAGTATLTNANNSINTIAGGTSVSRISTLNFNNNKALTVGTVGTAGIFTTAAIELATSSGDVLLTEPINSTLASGDAVKLFADKDALAGAIGDGNIKFSSNGAVTIVSDARALFYSGTETASTGLTTVIGSSANYRYNIADNTVLASIIPAIATTGRFGLLRATANADLSALAINAGTLTPTFAAATIGYAASVSNATTSITVTPTRSDANATITVNGTAVTSGSASGAINLTVGANTITTVVTAQNGTTTKTYTVTVTRRQTQTITFSALSAATFNDADIAPGATSSSGLTVNYASSNTAVATIVSGNIRIVGAGSAVITASQIGNASFDAATDVQRTLTVNKGTATLTLSNLTPTYDGTAKSATITTSPAGLSGVAITYAGSATAPTAAGTYAVIASLTNDNYTATNATGSLVIGKAIQTITFPALASKTTSDVDYEPGATVNSGLALRYTSSNTAVATVYQDAADGNKWKISIQGSGTTDITAIQDGNSDYNSASFLRALTVGIPLPVTLVSYDAKLKTNGTVQLTWLTASETNNSYFELQRSTDGITFTTIGKVTGAGNSTQEKRYDFIDLSPLAGTNYYKLLQYDKDGKKTDLGVRSVKVLLKENELTVYPNPSNGIVNVSFDINSYQKVELVDLTGKILMTKTIGRQASTISFDISDLSAGVYNIRLTGERKLAIKQIVKH